MTTTQAARETILIEDNATLATVIGPLDSHLVQIEAASDANVMRQGNDLVITGNADDVVLVRSVIQSLIMRAQSGDAIENSDVDGALRMNGFAIQAKTPAPQFPRFDQNSLNSFDTPKKKIIARSPAQADFIQSLYSHELAFGLGPAGTGKTYLAVAAAASFLQRGQVEKIILSRPAVEAGERIGFLPGDMKEKIDPYMQPLYDALNDFFPGKQLGRMYEDKTIEIAPLAFMRGRTLARAFVVLDEAQNATIPQMKMFLTRLGEGSRMAITGDESQVDLPRGVASGLVDAVKRFKDIEAISMSRFTDKDVVRHPIVAEIIRAYASDENEREAERSAPRFAKPRA